MIYLLQFLAYFLAHPVVHAHMQICERMHVVYFHIQTLKGRKKYFYEYCILYSLDVQKTTCLTVTAVLNTKKSFVKL